jgi:ATP-binding cassette ChvD family protein
MNPEFIFHMRGLTKRLPDGRNLFSDIGLSFFPGAKIGVVGPNGAGKSTVLRIMAGIDTEYDGETWFDPEATAGFLAQEPELDPELDVRGNVELGVARVRDLLVRYDAVNARFAEPMEADEMDALILEQGEIQDRIEAVGAWELDRTLEIAMDALRVPKGDADVTTLSGGERRRVALCSLLLSKPDLLLLDEPTNHLDAESVAWLERTLREYPGTVIVVTHDRYFLDNVTEWILELEGGKGLPFKGNYTAWLEQKTEILRQQDKLSSSRARTLTRELEWARLSGEARNNHSSARLREYDQRLQRASATATGRRGLTIAIPPGPRLGDMVIDVEGLSKGYGERLLIEDLSFSLPRGGIVGVVGPNGAGKSTLFNMLCGDEEPDEGTVTVGETVQIASMAQLNSAIDDERTVWENISNGNDIMLVAGEEVSSRAYCGAFGFKGRSQQQTGGSLSGGERGRLALAMVLQESGNLILLDEPTNDLDVASLAALEEALESFPGCAVIISHDRWFLDRIATHILAFEGDSHVEWFQGNYAAYEANRRRRLGGSADRPHRIKYKPLTRS